MAGRTGRKPHQKTLTLATVAELAGGQAEAIVNAALRAAVRDTEDRGADGKPRKVTIELELKKIGRDGTGVAVFVRAKTTLPPYATDPTIGDLGSGDRGQAELNFSPVAPDHPDQPQLPIDEE